MFLLTSFTAVVAIKLNTETKVINSQASTLNDYILVDTKQPPYQDELDDNGITGWVHANKNDGRLEGFAMAQDDTPFSDGYGWIACEYRHDQTYNSIEQIDFVFSEFYAHIGGNLLWIHGSASISIGYEVYRNGYKEKTGVIWEKSKDAFPNYNYQKDDAFTKTVSPNVDFVMNDQSPENVEIRITGGVYCSAGEGFASCEFDLKLSSIKIYGNKPDIVVGSTYTIPSEFNKGERIKVRTEVTNEGGSTARNFVNTVYLDGSKIGSYTTSSLAPEGIFDVSGESFEFTWPNDRDSHEIKVIADSGKDVAESNENNNEKTLSKSAPRDKNILILDSIRSSNVFQRLKLISFLPIYDKLQDS
jgi:hypothetical protein